MLDEVAAVRVPTRKRRHNKRGVKRKMSNYPLRRGASSPGTTYDEPLQPEIVIR